MPYPQGISEDGHTGDPGGIGGFAGARAEQLLGRMTRDVLDNAALAGLVGRAFEARAKAAQAQKRPWAC